MNPTQLLETRISNSAKVRQSQAQELAERLVMEATKICTKSDRLDANNLDNILEIANIKLNKILEYYLQPLSKGYNHLKSKLVSISWDVLSRSKFFSYDDGSIQDFLQDFLSNSYKVFLKERHLPENYSPKTKLEQCEFLAFCENFANRKVNGGRRIITLRALGFTKNLKSSKELALDMEMILEPAEDFKRSYFTEGARERLADFQELTQSNQQSTIENTEEPQKVIAKFKEYLALKKKWDSLKYFELLLEDADAPEIEKIMGLTRETRDYAQQKLKYQIFMFSRQHYWKLVHEWLGASLEENLGLTPKQWERFIDGLSKPECRVLEFKKRGVDDKKIARAIALTPAKIPVLWRNVLESASAYRNGKICS